MPLVRDFLGRAWRTLARHLAELGRALDGLVERLRDDVAYAVGRAAADAAREAVLALLAGPRRAAWPPPGPVRGPRPWGSRSSDAYEPAWGESASESWRPDDLEDDRPEEPPAPVASQPAGWRGAVVVGCGAAAGWLRRHRRRFPLLTAAAAGLLAAVAWCAGGPSSDGLAAWAFGPAHTAPSGAAVRGALGTS
jgi:hypothetical protein